MKNVQQKPKLCGPKSDSVPFQVATNYVYENGKNYSFADEITPEKFPRQRVKSWFLRGQTARELNFGWNLGFSLF